MKRRELITLLGGAAATWPLSARGQQSARLPAIGYLGPSNPANTVPTTSAFRSIPRRPELLIRTVSLRQ